MNNSKTYLFFGNVGAGKGTQIALIKDFLEKNTSRNTVYAYPGEFFRTFIKEQSVSSELGKKILDRGNLMPLFLVAHAVTTVMTKNLKSQDDHLIFDGFPRSIEQIPVFESILKFYERIDPEIVYIDISKDEAKKRLLARGRHDDTEEGIDNRFDEYERNVIPALETLKKSGMKFHKINGEQSVEEVREDLFSSLGLSI